MTWEALWGWFLQNKELQESILEQIDLKSWIQHKATDTQIEILQFAPQEVRNEVKDLLHYKALVKLGLFNLQ